MTDVVELLQELIRFDTTNPPGNETACIEHVQRILEEAGAQTTIVAKDDVRPNLIARVQGAGEAPPLLLYGHVDVVTTAGQQWTRDPFGGELVDGWVWGRGALDMKGGVAMLIDAFTRAARGELKPRGDLILAVLSDEENGGDFGARFLADEHAELFEGVRHALGEFGGARVQLGGKSFYPIQVAEKQICWLRGKVHGPGGHAALGVAGSAMSKTGRILAKLDSGRLPVHVTPVARAWIEGMAEASSGAQALFLRSLLEPRLAEIALRAPSPKLRMLDRALRNTVTATIVHGGSKINVIPSEIELELDARSLPGYGPDDVIREIGDLVGPALELEVVRHDPYPAHSDLSQLPLLYDILRELDANAIPVPLLQVGVTDGRFFARLGIQTYGFLPLNLPDDVDFLKLVHAADERVPAEAIRFGAEAVGRVIERYAA
ncbi:MAG TPA: M20/M25/M40 family metallo-hydrolase [Gaiellaceae bacterium]|nr:M20/M25/M40 family metallo-hydrolase [Gaiellaceae bacterium]